MEARMEKRQKAVLDALGMEPYCINIPFLFQPFRETTSHGVLHVCIIRFCATTRVPWRLFLLCNRNFGIFTAHRPAGPRHIEAHFGRQRYNDLSLSCSNDRVAVLSTHAIRKSSPVAAKTCDICAKSVRA